MVLLSEQRWICTFEYILRIAGDKEMFATNADYLLHSYSVEVTWYLYLLSLRWRAGFAKTKGLVKLEKT